MDAVTIFYIILLLAASALCVALIVYLNRITKSIKEVENDIKDLSLQLKPLIASAANLSENLDGVTQQVKDQLRISRGIVEDFRNRADKILEFEEKVRTKIETPVNGFIKNFSAVVNGFNAFKNAYKKNNNY